MKEIKTSLSRIERILSDKEAQQQILKEYNGSAKLDFYETCRVLMDKVGLNYEDILQNREGMKQGELYYLLKQKSHLYNLGCVARYLNIAEKRVRSHYRNYINSPAIDKRVWKPKRIKNFWEL